MAGESKSHHPWGIVAFSAAVAAGVVGSIIIWAAGQLTSQQPSTPAPVPSGPDAVRNIQLTIGPPEIPLDGSAFTTIEILGATPNTFIDMEIIQPSTAVSGACSRMDPPTSDSCNLAYLGGGESDADGYFSMSFPDPDMELIPGLYTVVIQDRHTAAVVESYIAVK
ncbi:hypothetical protein ACNPNP_00035 [Microbacterium sp. AGC85]